MVRLPRRLPDLVRQGAVPSAQRSRRTRWRRREREGAEAVLRNSGAEQPQGRPHRIRRRKTTGDRKRLAQLQSGDAPALRGKRGLDERFRQAKHRPRGTRFAANGKREGPTPRGRAGHRNPTRHPIRRQPHADQAARLHQGPDGHPEPRRAHPCDERSRHRHAGDPEGLRAAPPVRIQDPRALHGEPLRIHRRCGQARLQTPGNRRRVPSRRGEALPVRARGRNRPLRAL